MHPHTVQNLDTLAAEGAVGAEERLLTCADVDSVLGSISVVIFFVLRGVFPQGDAPGGGRCGWALIVTSKGAVILHTNATTSYITTPYDTMQHSTMHYDTLQQDTLQNIQYITVRVCYGTVQYNTT